MPARLCSLSLQWIWQRAAKIASDNRSRAVSRVAIGCDGRNAMEICPHCHKRGISFWAKWRSGALIPAVCRECGSKSYIHPLVGGSWGAFAFLALLYATFQAFVAWSWDPLLVFLVVWFLLSTLVSRFAPLKARNFTPNKS